MRQRGGLHLGVVGVGRMGAVHARTLTSLEGVGAVSVADADPSRARRVADMLDVEAVGSPDELVDRGIDGLVIATSTSGHVPLLRLAARGGLPAFCEKPVALELDTLDSLLADVERAGALVQVGFQRRFDPGYRAAHDAVAGGALGTLLAVRAATHDHEPPSEAYIATSGGIFRDLHIHDFDAIRFVTLEDPVEVYADGAVRESAWFARHGDVDTAAALLRLKDGALVVVTGARHDGLGYDARLEVFGTEDSVTAGGGPRSPLRALDPAERAPRGPPYRDFLDRFEAAYRTELAAFVAAIRNGGSSPVGLGEARAALVIALAADRSRAERRPVSIEEVTRA